jgi:lipopolysaccharide transport system ATP-binding protein
MTSITASGLGVHFVLDRQMRATSPTLLRVRGRTTELWGLEDVSVKIGGGEGVALLGPTGAGKTTLLRAFAGVYGADAGRLTLRGRVGAVLSTEAGLIPALTGRENAVLLAVLSGLSRAEARSALGDIRERSGLGDAFDRPVGTYSQGMQARLGFTVAERADPEILLLDEVHEAVDHDFRLVVEERARSLITGGGIVVATGHDHHLLERFCSRALLLDGARILEDGPFAEVQRSYLDR